MTGDLGAYWKSMARGRDFRVQAVARERRELAIARAEEAVQRQRGDILDFKMFSNLSLNMVIEMSGGGVLALIDSLAALGWHVEVDPDRDALAGCASDRLEGTFQVTFPESDGELVIPVPTVPG
jgi:hypothetical protein